MTKNALATEKQMQMPRKMQFRDLPYERFHRPGWKILFHTRFRYRQPVTVRRNEGLVHVLGFERQTAAPKVNKAVVSRFEELTGRWESETAFLSSLTDIVLHPAYQKIIGMGEKVVPLILQDLRGPEEPRHWFWALEAIIGANPVPADSEGNITSMAEHWIEWGKQNGYID